jgi:hypothetical protein
VIGYQGEIEHEYHEKIITLGVSIVENCAALCKKQSKRPFTIIYHD